MTMPIRLLATCAAITMGGWAMAADRGNAPPDPRVVAGVAEFTIDLYRAVAASPGNVFCSPLNVAVAIDMTAAGAKGETAGEIARTLHLDGLGDSWSDGLGKLADAAGKAIQSAGGKGADATAGLWTANAGWFAEGEEILPEYLTRLDRAYRAEPHRVDFVRSPDAARETINAWVADQTRDKIRDLLKPEHVRPGTVFVLTSAIYFKGYWSFPFSPSETKDDTFRADTGPIPVKMMNQTVARLPYIEDETVQAATLPYQDGSLAMTIVLPKQADGLAAVEASLSPERLRAWTSNPRPTRVKLSLPRFKSTAEIDLKDVLTRLGMPAAFDAARADFSGINGKRDLFLSAVVHKAFVEVEEKGTEAAAATGLVGARSAAITPQGPVVFRADHPFLYLIRDVKSGAILFIGRQSR